MKQQTESTESSKATDSLQQNLNRISKINNRYLVELPQHRKSNKVN